MKGKLVIHTHSSSPFCLLSHWLKARTVGLPLAINRLLRFRVVRCTRPVVKVGGSFVGQEDYRNRRDPTHIAAQPAYPDPEFHLSFPQKYFFRHGDLRHLRLEQFNRYLYIVDNNSRAHAFVQTAEDTIEDDPDAAPKADMHHMNYDAAMESVPEGKHFPSTVKGLQGCKRRKQFALGVGRSPIIEPVGQNRERYYEAKLLLALPWYCAETPKTVVDAAGIASTQWTFQCEVPLGPRGKKRLITFQYGGGQTPSFEFLCKTYEEECCSAELDLVCRCCTGELSQICKTCRNATGFHQCAKDSSRTTNRLRWRKGTLYGGTLDIQRVLFNLHRKMLPMKVLTENAAKYVAEGHIDKKTVDRVLRCIEKERGVTKLLNDGAEKLPDDYTSSEIPSTEAMNAAELKSELDRIVEMLRTGAAPGRETDQFRVYSYITRCIEEGRYLRLLIQACAGSGKSFLLNAVLSNSHQEFDCRKASVSFCPAPCVER